jgi:hypothetical protein
LVKNAKEGVKPITKCRKEADCKGTIEKGEGVENSHKIQGEKRAD